MRYKEILAVAVALIERGDIFYCPILQTHHIALVNKKVPFEFWEKFDKDIIRRCDKLVIATIPGWDVSQGIGEEIKFAELINLPIEYLDVEELLSATNR